MHTVLISPDQLQKKKDELDLEAKLSQASVVEKILSVDSQGRSDSPFVVELDPTTLCDLACPGCISEDLLNKNRFSNERLLQLGHEMVNAGVRAVILIGGGEPLAHPAIGDLINIFGKHDVKVGITTNGTMIDRHIDSIARYSSWTRVSVDAATNETFAYLRPDKRGKSKLELVINNMRMLAERKTGNLGFSFLIRTEADGGTISRSNIDEIYAAAVLAKDVGCDYFEVKPSYDLNHYLVQHHEEQMLRAKLEIERLPELETDSFKILKSVNLDFTLDNKNQHQPKDYHSCPAAQLRTLVTPSGCYVCPYFRGREDMRIGDVHEQSFAEMWAGHQRQITMERLDPSEHCQMHCIRHKSNLKVMEMRNQPERIRTIEDFNFFI